MPDDSLLHLLRDTRRLLNFHRHCGLHYPLTKALDNALTERHPPAALPATPTAPAEMSSARPAESQPPSATLEDLKGEIVGCRRCPLAGDGGVMLFGEGRENEPALCIISAPRGMTESEKHQTISGEARELLVRMLAAINLTMADVFLTNIVKCPATNGPVTAEQAAACLPLLLRQLDLLRPRVICTMGQLASQVMLKSSAPLLALRGRFHTIRGLPLLATFHPSLLLKSPEMKKAAWQDLQLIQKKLALPVPGKL
ncbi:MAG: uracil-DNA glycosylase [Thermodesulfobacteriota bacterium]